MRLSESESHSVVSDWLTATAWNSPGWNTGVGSFSLLQGVFPTQGSNPGLSHCKQILYQLSHKGSPRILEWVAYPFSRWFLTQELNRGFLHRRHVLYQLSYKGRWLRRKSSPKWKLMQKHCTHPLDLAFVLETSKLADCLNVIISPWFSFSKWEVGEDAWEPASSFLKVYLFIIEG